VQAWGELPAAVRRVLLGDLLSATGSGLVLPFLFVYLAQVRDLGEFTGGIAVGAVAGGSMVANPIAGRAVDSRGARAVLQLGLVLAAAGDVALLLAQATVTACLATALFGMGTGTAMPALHSLLGSATPHEHRPTAFALQYALTNVGFSLGALLAALLVDFEDPASFVRVFLADAVSYLLFAAWLALPGARILTRDPDPGQPQVIAAAASGYRDVLGDARFRRLCLVNGLLVVCGFAQYHAALPAFAGRDGGLSASQLALVFAANTVAVAFLQLPVLAATRRVPRARLVAMGAGCFAVCWVAVGWSGQFGGTTGAVVLVAGAAAVLGLGETFLSPALGPLVNEMAPEHLRGRYNAVDTFVLSAGSILGPLLAGWALAAGATGGLFGALAIGCLLAAALTPALQHPRPTSSG
jgi:MFS family permease